MIQRLCGALIALAVLASPACGGQTVPEGTSGKKIQDVSPSLVPGEILDLTVRPEDIRSTLVRVERSYIAEAGLFSMRREDQVQATLQVLRFNSAADLEDESFRGALVGQIGGATPQIGRVGGERIYSVRGVQQNLAVFFKGPYLLVLSIRDEYEQPRNLLRQVLEIDL